MNQTSQTVMPEADYPLPRKARSRYNHLFYIIILLLAAPPFLGTLLGFLGKYHWTLDLFSHFRVQYAAALLLAMAGMEILRRHVPALILFVAVILNLAVIAPLYVHPDASALIAQPSLTLMHFNVAAYQCDHDETIRYLDQADADLLIIHEVNHAMFPKLRDEMRQYQVVIAQPRNDYFGQVVFERVAEDHVTVINARLIDMARGTANIQNVELILEVESRQIAILGLHVPPPLGKMMTHARDTMLTNAAIWAAEKRAEARVIIGDFNATPWSWGMRKMFDHGDLVNSQKGFGIAGTWPASGRRALFPGRLPIDHCLHSRELVTVEREQGAAMGSDHRPMTVGLKWVNKP